MSDLVTHLNFGGCQRTGKAGAVMERRADCGDNANPQLHCVKLSSTTRKLQAKSQVHEAQEIRVITKTHS